MSNAPRRWREKGKRVLIWWKKSPLCKASFVPVKCLCSCHIARNTTSVLLNEQLMRFIPPAPYPYFIIQWICACIRLAIPFQYTKSLNNSIKAEERITWEEEKNKRSSPPPIYFRYVMRHVICNILSNYLHRLLCDLNTTKTVFTWNLSGTISAHILSRALLCMAVVSIHISGCPLL